jgi:3-dehydroquinate synthase
MPDTTPRGTTTVGVALGARSYDILIGPSLLEHAGSMITARHPGRRKAAIITDENVAPHYLKRLEAALAKFDITSTSIVLPPGEKTKSFETLNKVCGRLLAAEIERKDIVIALGGGVIGDLAGFAAAIVRRGVGFVQIPTSLLAMVDSSVGGKTGINSEFGKNLIGAFYQPSLVLADLELLKTLPKRELSAGYAEVAKYGLLGDGPFLTWLETNIDAIMSGDASAIHQAVKVCCEAKARIVAEDETETGVRALLNLGHTFGHALEAATGYSGAILHGEAVAMGMIQAFRFSAALGHCDAALAERIAAHLRRASLPTTALGFKEQLPGPARLLEIMRQDKKASGGKLTFILARGIGKAFVERNVDDEIVLNFLKEDIDRK